LIGWPVIATQPHASHETSITLSEYGSGLRSCRRPLLLREEQARRREEYRLRSAAIALAETSVSDAAPLAAASAAESHAPGPSWKTCGSVSTTAVSGRPRGLDHACRGSGRL
jgi:hypothetical protein